MKQSANMRKLTRETVLIPISITDSMSEILRRIFAIKISKVPWQRLPRVKQLQRAQHSYRNALEKHKLVEGSNLDRNGQAGVKEELKASKQMMTFRNHSCLRMIVVPVEAQMLGGSVRVQETAFQSLSRGRQTETREFNGIQLEHTISSTATLPHKPDAILQRQ